MDILLNELSLNGQFANIEEFEADLIKNMLPILQGIRESSLCLMKKQNFYSYKVTPNDDLNTILTIRQRDSIRSLKGRLVNTLLKEPFWDGDQKHSNKDSYLYNDESINNTSLAEACERDKLTLSFDHKAFYDQFIKIKKNSEEITLNNITDKNSLLSFLFESKQIDIDNFIKNKFSGTNINFSKLKKNFGFNIVEHSNEIQIFLNCFEKFSKMEWTNILRDKGFNYKEFQNKKKFKEIPYEIDKFRITRKYRCFGYRKQDTFYAILFETDHKLSDKG